jgi:hypothetical protein
MGRSRPPGETLDETPLIAEAGGEIAGQDPDFCTWRVRVAAAASQPARTATAGSEAQIPQAVALVHYVRLTYEGRRVTVAWASRPPLLGAG